MMAMMGWSGGGGNDPLAFISCQRDTLRIHSTLLPLLPSLFPPVWCGIITSTRGVKIPESSRNERSTPTFETNWEEIITIFASLHNNQSWSPRELPNHRTHFLQIVSPLPESTLHSPFFLIHLDHRIQYFALVRSYFSSILPTTRLQRTSRP